MLRKLIKYEWRETRTMGLILVGAIILATLMGVFSIYTMSLFMGDEEGILAIASGITGMFSFLAYMLIVVGTIYGILIYLSVRFYQSMYTDRGYLLHTLPVTKHQILGSKILVGTVWLYVIYLMLFLSAVLSIFSIVVAVAEPGVIPKIPDAVGAVAQFIREVWIEMFGSDEGLFLLGSHYVVSLLLLALISLPSQLLLIYGAISMGQLFKKYRALWALLFVMLFSFARVILSYIVSLVLMVGLSLGNAMLPDNELFMMHMYAFQWDATWIIGLVLSVVFYKVTHWILTRKLNMA